MKTIRGTYYYIEMAGAFYAGTRPIMKEVTVIKDREWTDKEKQKPLYRRNERHQHGWTPMYPTRKGQRHTHYSGGHVHLQVKKPAEKVTESVPTAEYVDVWTEDFKKAKQFRLKSKAEAKATELGMSDKVKPKVLFYKGDQK